MSNINLTSPVFYAGGTSGASSVVGYESKQNRVVRYTLASSSTGASRVSLAFSGNSVGNGTTPESLYFYIGTDAGSHANAGAGTACTGTLERTSGTYAYSGGADILLLPGTTYYVWVFPASTTFGWVAWSTGTGNAVASLSGGSVSTLAASSGTLGTAQTLTVTRCSADFTHTVTYSFGSATGTVCTKSSATTLSWTPPLSLASQIPSATSGSCALTITTYSGSVQVGAPQSILISLTVPDSVVPTASLDWSDSSGAYGAMGVLVQNVSKLAVAVNASGAYGSTVVSTAVTLAGKAYSGAVLSSSGAQTLAVTVTDSRGRTGWASLSLSVAPYAAPSLTLSASRCNADGTADDTGEYAKLTVTGFVTQVNSRNTASLKVTYGSTSETAAYTPGTAFTWTKTVSAPSTASMALSAALTDRLLTTTRSMTLSVGYATMDFLKGGKGIAFGATATQEGFHCAMPVSGNLPSLGRKTRIPESGANISTYTTPGTYAVFSNACAAACTGLPCAVAGTLTVEYSIAPAGVTWGQEYLRHTYLTYENVRYTNWSWDGGQSWAGWECKEGDWVVEQGTSGSWAYRKWGSGLAECWGVYSPGAVSCESYQWNGAYFKNIDGTALPDGLFRSLKSLQWSPRATNFNGWFYKDSGISASATGSFGMAGVAGFSNITVHFDIYATGTWK